MKRVTNHPIIDFVHKEPIGFYFEGNRCFGVEGDTIASALMSNGVREFRMTEKKRKAEAFFAELDSVVTVWLLLMGFLILKVV